MTYWRVKAGAVARELRRVFFEEPTQRYGHRVEVAEDLRSANVCTSLIHGRRNRHAPVLDLDIPHFYVPSSTEGHGHLYLDLNLTPTQYWALLDALATAGVLEAGYVNASKQRGFTCVRLPWVRKET